MPIKTNCPSCDAQYNVADKMRGKNVCCKACGNGFVVTATITAPPVETPADGDLVGLAPVDSAKQSPATSMLPKTIDGTDGAVADNVNPEFTFNGPSNLMNCPDCGKQVSKKAASCPECGCPIATQNRQPDPVVRMPSRVQNTRRHTKTSANNAIVISVVVFGVLAVIIGVILYSQKDGDHVSRGVNTQKSTEDTERAAVESWDKFAAQASSKAQQQLARETWIKEWPDGWLFFKTPHTDLVKSESLKASIIGVIRQEVLQLRVPEKKSPLALGGTIKGASVDYEYELRFAFKDNKWEFLDGTYEITGISRVFGKVGDRGNMSKLDDFQEALYSDRSDYGQNPYVQPDDVPDDVPGDVPDDVPGQTVRPRPWLHDVVPDDVPAFRHPRGQTTGPP